MSANGIPPKPQQGTLATGANPPSQTLYLKNLNDKVSKEDLRRALYTLFATHGHILDIVALKTPKMRGQAHIVYRSVQNSTQAMQTLQGVEFLGKELRISYGKGRSDIISKLDGSAKVPETAKPAAPINLEAKKPSFAPAPGAALKPSQPPTGSLKAPNGVVSDGSKSPLGTKRPRDDESDEDEPMQEDDEGEEMDVSDED